MALRLLCCALLASSAALAFVLPVPAAAPARTTIVMAVRTGTG